MVKNKKEKKDIDINEFKEKIKDCQDELLKLDSDVKKLESKMLKIVHLVNESRERDKELRKKIETMLRKLQGNR